MVDYSAVGYPQSDSSDAPTLAPSTIHRWITTLGRFTQTCRTALSLMLQENPVSSACRNLAQIIVPFRKYRSEHRKNQLLNCRKLLIFVRFTEHLLRAFYTPYHQNCVYRSRIMRKITLRVSSDMVLAVPTSARMCAGQGPAVFGCLVFRRYSIG